MRYVTKHDLPWDETPCIKNGCIYNDEGLCDEPFINYGNSDAECFGERPRIVLKWLGVLESEEAQDEAG